MPKMSTRPGNFDTTGPLFNPKADNHVLDPVRIPSLRGARYLAPYGHDGRMASLRDFVRNVVVGEFAGPEPSPALLDGRPLVIDALFGAGLTRPIEGVAAELIERMTRDRLSVVAVDVPSGLHGDTGGIMGIAPRAEETVTFFRGKPGHYSLEGLRRCGVLHVVDIGIPPSVLDAIRPQLWRNAPPLWSAALRRDDAGDNKYTRGHLTILGGDSATGAARLAALAARRAGAGLVTIATTEAAAGIYRAAEPGNLVNTADVDRLIEDRRRNAFLIGPGSGVSLCVPCSRN